MFGIFETANEAELREQCMDDFAYWGFDSEKCKHNVEVILERIGTDDEEWPRPLESLGSDGVTRADLDWYWGLPPEARAAMRYFDDAIRADMWIRCHARNLSIEDLEADLARHIPEFSNDSSSDDADGPLPHELRRRFQAFIARIRGQQEEWDDWASRTEKATSMNSLIRTMIRRGKI